jgi:predicted nucleotidyltransferase
MNQWKTRRAELEAELSGFDLAEVAAHDEKVKELFINLSAENAAELKALLAHPNHQASQLLSELNTIKDYMGRTWYPSISNRKCAVIEVSVKGNGFNGTIVTRK